MKLSVVIPVYNGANFLNKAYNSILSQVLNSYDYEIIFVDNNSTDDSVKVIKELQEKNSKVKLFTEQIQGAAAARNRGIKNACGDYIYMFDVDDEIYPNALDKMIKVLDSYTNVDAVFGKMVKSNKGISETIKPLDETDEVIMTETPYWGIHWFTSLKHVVGPPAFLYRKEVFEKIGNYNVALRIGQDTALDIKLGMTCKLAFLDTYVYLYFKHQQSSIQKAKLNQNMIFHTWVRLTKEHLPFWFSHEHDEDFKRILFPQLYGGMGKIIYYTKGLGNRIQVYKQIAKDINPLKLSFSIKLYLLILVVFPIENLLKFYVYYFSKWYVKKHLDDF